MDKPASDEDTIIAPLPEEAASDYHNSLSVVEDAAEGKAPPQGFQVAAEVQNVFRAVITLRHRYNILAKQKEAMWGLLDRIRKDLERHTAGEDVDFSKRLPVLSRTLQFTKDFNDQYIFFEKQTLRCDRCGQTYKPESKDVDDLIGLFQDFRSKHAGCLPRLDVPEPQGGAQ